MVAIVSGNSLGLSLSSLATLGQRGVLGSSAQGRSGEQSFVNVANGNLVLQDFDDKLVGRGLDISVVRTYNSQGLLNDDNGDNWTVGAFGQRVILTGTVASAGSTLVRTDRDGASATYTWDTARNLYVSNAGAGAFNTISFDSVNARYIWTDGATGLIERYESTGLGRLVSVTDPAGNTVSYTYNANGTLQHMVDANGETTWFDYSGSNLTQVRTAITDGAVVTRVRYAYDTANRLSSVTVDLSPEDNSVADGKTYVTTYTYDGTSKRVASVTQSDGTQLSFTYVQAGGAYKVATVTDALGAVTRFSYDTTQNATTVTDPLGAQSTYLYDSQGQLLQMRQGVTAGNPSGLSQISYRYDAAGNVTGVTDGEGREVVYEYDANGNLLKETDSAGNLHTRTYNAANQLLTETVYADAAVSRGAFSQQASLPEITRYVYAQDNPRLLRFVLSPQGGVTEHRYNSYGQALATIRYTGGSYSVTSLSTSAVPTEAQMSTWVGSQDLRRTERTDRTYDARGAQSSSTTYGEVDASGAGVTATAAKTQYVYDQHGLLLKSIDPSAGTITYVYDGLGRVLSISAPSLNGEATPNTTTTSYDDANGKTSVTIASGLVTVSAYDKAGRLVSVTQQSAGIGVLGTTSYAYDKDGNLLMTQDPTGVRKWMLYDAANRKIADIDATGALIEYVYNASGQLRQTVAYATKLSAAKLAQLVDGAGLPTTAWSSTNTTTSLAALRPAGVAQDQKVWRFYDNAGRLAWQVDALGYVTQTTYDGASRVLSVSRLANAIDVTPLLNGADVNLGVDPTTLGGIALSLNNNEPVPSGRVTVLTATAEDASLGSMATFFDGETVIGSAMLVDGKASLVIDRLSVGTHDMRVAFSGNALRPASVSKAVRKIITPAVITAELNYLSPTPGSAEPLILSLSLSADATWLVPETGKVVFYNGGVVLGEARVANGTANLVLNSWPTGRLNVRAEYPGDATHTSSIVHRSFVPVPPSMTLSASAENVTDGRAVTLHAKVAGGSTTSSVAFFAGKVSLGVANVVNGVATLVVDFLQAGTYALSATYSGNDELFAGVLAKGPTLQVDVSQENAEYFEYDLLAPYDDPSKVNWGYSISTNVTSWAEPDGPIQVGRVPSILISDDSKSLGTGGTYSVFIDDVLVGSVVHRGTGGGDRFFTFALPINLAPNKQHRLTIALYSDRAAYMAPSGTRLSRTVVMNTVISVEKAPTATTLNVSPARAPEGAPITLGTKISMALPHDVKGGPLSEAPPSIGGVVTFYSNGTVIGTATVVNGQASLIVQNLPHGLANITASYAGDGNFLGSQPTDSASVQVTPPSVTLTNLTTPAIGKDGSLSVHVAGQSPTGLISFYSGTTLLGTVAVREDGTATLRGVPIPAGSHAFSAVYSGDESNADGAITFTQIVEGTPDTPRVLVGLDITQDRTTTQLYNHNGQLQGVLDAEGYLTEYKYNAAGERIETIRYANRAANFSSVSARMMAVAIARASGDLTGLRPKPGANDIHTYTLYNARGQAVGQVDGEGYLTETIYDVRGNVVQTKRYASPAKNPGSASATLASVRPDPSALDQTVTQTWSAANQLLSRTNVEGTITTFTYDAAGRLVQTTTAAGTADERTQRLRYDIQGNLIAELDGRGSDAVALIDPLAKWSANGSTHAYDAAGRRTSTTDANGHRTLFFYDALGRLTYTVNALGEVTESHYNAHGQVDEQIVYGTRVNVSTLGATTPGGLNTDTLKAQLAAVADPAKDTHVLNTYNATGTKATTVDGLGNTTRYSYNAFREVTASTQTRLSGQIITNAVAFDRRGQQISSTLDSAGAAITRRTGYDAFGRVDTRIDANGNVSRVAYDRLGRVVTTTDANGAEHVTIYDAFDRVLTQRDALGNITSYAYNLVDRSVTVTTPEGVSVTIVHNRQGQTSSVTDGRGNTTSYSYDKSGNLLQTQAPQGVGTSATYDKTGLKLTSTDARGTVTAYSYDAANRLLTRTVDPTGLQLTTSYQYDAKGQAIRVTDPGGIVTVTEYDLNGQIASQTIDPSNGAYVGLNLRTVYTHDADGTTLSVQGPDGKLTRYTYDGAGRRIKEQIDPLGLNLTRSYTYDGEGNVAKSIDGEGNATLFIYDKANRLAFTIDAMGGVQQNSYDAEGRLSGQSIYAAFVPVAAWNGVAPSLSTMQALLPTLGAVATQSRRYDRDGRLSFSVDATGAVVKYSYDAGGNVIETRAYAQRIDLNQWNDTIDPPVVADDTHDQRSRSVYDALGRKTYTIDGTGAVVQQVFDANGNVKERFAYSLRVPVATAATTQALAAAVALVADPARDQHDIYVYDRAGRQTSRTDGMGAVTTQTYDSNGNVTSRTDAKSQVTRYTYDAAGRLVHTLGPLGHLEKNTYDSAGRITLTTRYAKAVDTTGLGTTLTPDQLQALAAPRPEQDQQQYSVYDKSGRLSATVDALGNVVTFVRDGNGQITKRSAWASPISLTAWVPGTMPAPSVDPANDQHTRIFYDGAGREALTVDALGYAVRRQYDAQGQLERVTRYATAVPAQTANTYGALLQAATNGAAGASSAPQITVYGYDAAGNRIRQTSAFGQPEAATTLYFYDGLGRLTRTIDPRGVELSQSDTPSALNERKLLGYINAGSGGLKSSDLSPTQREELAARYSTVNEYDAAGHKISVTDALGGVTRSEYDATGHVVRITDPRGNAAFYYFDAAGRVTLSVDPEGYATATTYDPLGQTLSVKRYFNRVSGTYGITQPPTLPNANPSDALTRFEYDAAGRLSRTIDAESNSENYTYNALGQRETLTNKLGGTTTYTYDQLGRKVSETLPVTSRNADGQSVAVVNRYVYDAFGNKTGTTEAAGLPEQRVTQFKYDGLNREIEQRQAAVSIYTAAGGWTTVTPTRRNTYDASGNLIAVVDPNGGRARAWFDANNRKVAEVSATGTLSTWGYDPAGNVMAQNIYGDVLSLPVGDAQPVPLNAANVRTTTYKVDANNRILSSTIAQVEYGEYNSKTGQYTVFDRRDLTQRSFYDANGNVVRQENAANAASLTWYDKLGQKVLEVDAMGYGVRWERDANGAVFRETRFAKSIVLGSLSESTKLDTILAKFEPQASDQITEYTYDHNGRTTSESRLGVAYASVGSSGTLTEGVATATQRYGYDAMGNRTSVTDALNQRTDRDYDKLGRLLSERKPQAAVNTGAGTSASLRQTTEYEYDGLNNIRREIRRGIDNTVETDDEIVRYGYDATGVRTSMVTARGETFTYGRDANGNNTAQMVDRQDADGSITREMVSIAFDAANRETTRFTGTRDAANAPIYDAASTVTLGYNAWGELASKRTGSGDANGAAQEYYDYDKAGRLWRSNSQGGVSKAWLYDMAGNATLQLESQRLNLRTMSLQEMTGNGSKPSPDILVTITSYDRNNRAVSVVQPKMDASRPNLIMYAAPLNVESGQYGGLDIAVANPLAGTTSIQAPSDTSPTGAVSVLGMPFSGGNIRPITNGEAGIPGKSGNYSSTVVGVTDIVLGSNDGWTSSIENIYGAVTWRVEVGGVPNYLGRVTNWPVTVHPRNSDLNVMMGQLPGSLVLGNAFANTQMLPIRIVATVQSSGQDIVVSNGAIRKLPSPTQDQTLSGTFMRLTAGEARDSDTIQLYSRPAGSNGPFSQTLPVFKAGEGGSSLNNTSVNGWYLTRLESLSGPTELMLVVTQADGKVVRRESIQWNPATRQSTSSVGAAQPVFTADNVAHFTGLQTGGTSPAAILVRPRSAPQGTGTMYWPAGTAGRFDVQLGAGNNDLAIDMLNDRGVVMDTLVGTMNAGSSLYDMRFIGSQPSSITFRDIPKDATTLTIEYSPTSAGGQPAGSVTLTRQAGKAEWVWDARNLVADPRSLYSYALHFVARDADGFILTDATGNATIGAVNNGTKAALTGSVKHQILTFDPGVPEGRTLKIRYREKGATAQDFTEAMATRGTINAIFKWDATANNLNPEKEYEFLYDVYNAAGAVIGNGEGYFKPDTDISNDKSNSNAHWVIPNLPGGPVIPGQPSVVTGLWVVQRQQDYDAFGHVISEFDGHVTSEFNSNRNETRLYYNTLGLLTSKVGPTVNITHPDSQVQTTRPTEYYSYDLNGRLVGKRDANGNQSTVQIDAAGKTVAEWHPGAAAGSSTVVRKSYDIFGNLITVTDEIGRVTTNTYDLNNRLVRVDRPVNADGSRAFDTYEYDVLGQRIAHANALDFRERTYYDSMGRVTRYISAEGATVSYGYTYDNSIGSIKGVNTGGWINTTTDANGRTQTLKNDVFGRMMWKQDFGGHQFAYGYNWSGLIETQTGTSGQNINYTYYDNGYLRKVVDLGASTESTFEYDNKGNRTFEGFKSTAGDVAMVFQWSRVSYDAYNRVKTIDDARYVIDYEYDANGNRRRVKSTYKNVVDGSQETQDYWYAYDGMNRFTVTMGQMVNGQIVRGASGDGVTIEYDDAGQRKAATYAANATDPGHREDYAYDGAGNLTTVLIDGVLRSRRTNDLAGRVTRYEEWFKDGALSAQKDRTWNQDNQLTVEVEHRLTEGTAGKKWSDTTTAYTLMKDGTLSKVDSLTNAYNNFNPSAQDPAVVITRMISNYAYEWWDGAKQTAITLDPISTGYDPRRPQPPGYSVFSYDVNGHLKKASDVNRTTPRTFEYWTNAEGQVLQRQELVGGQVDSQTGVVIGASKSRDHRYFYFDGKRVGNVGNDGVEREDYAQQLARSSAAQSPDDKYRKFIPTNSADFDENYQPINASFPGPAPGSYTVREGDTLEGIARALWGDAQLWYLLAEANGLDGQPSAALTANTVLQVPNKVTNLHNTSSTFRPYDPGKAMGDTSPTLPDPLPAPRDSGGGCGGLGQIIVIVVAIVASIYTAGAAASALAPAGSAAAATTGFSATMSLGASAMVGSAGIGFGAGLAAAAAGGTVGSIASQGVGIAFGIQDSFSWKGVALSALSAGVSAGTGALLNVPGGLLSGSGNWATAGRLAVSNVASQGLSIATGLQKGFDWKGVAASAASGYVSASAGSWAKGIDLSPIGQSMVSSMAAGLMSTAVRGGSISRALPSIIGDAVGATVGNALGDSIAAANSNGSYRGIDPENPYGYQGTNGGITTWRASAASSISGVYVAPDIVAGGQEPDVSWIGEDLPPANPYANLSMRDGVQVAGGTTGFAPLGKSGQLTPDGSYVDLPKTRVAPVIELGSLQTITIDASAGSLPNPPTQVQQWAFSNGYGPLNDAAALQKALSVGNAIASGFDDGVPAPSARSYEISQEAYDAMGGSVSASLGGAVAGTAVSLGKMAYGGLRTASNAFNQALNIVSGGIFGNTQWMQQSLAENAALGNGIINAVRSPRETTLSLMESVANRYSNAMSLGDSFQQSYALSGLFSDMGQGAVALAYGGRGLAKFGASELRGLGVADWSIRLAPPNTLYMGGIGLELEKIGPTPWSFTPFRSSFAKLDLSMDSYVMGDSKFISMRSDQFFLRDGSLIPMSRKNPNGVNQMFDGYFTPATGDLHVSWMSTANRGMNFGTEMLSRAIEEAGPLNVKSISANLGADNLATYNTNLSRGMSPLEAAQNTPAAKIRAKLGFGNIQYDPVSNKIIGYRTQ